MYTRADGYHEEGTGLWEGICLESKSGFGK